MNEYIREIAGDDFSAKDFRTWIGTVECIGALTEPAEHAADAKQRIAQALRCVAGRLGNTPGVCRKAYVHPAVIETYTRLGQLPCRNGKITRQRANGLSRGERLALRFVEKWERQGRESLERTLERSLKRAKNATSTSRRA